MKGYHGRFLLVECSERRATALPLDETTLRTSVGGKGLGVHLLTRFLPSGTSPLSPEAPLVCVPGPAAGTRIWGSSRYGLFAKSPQTGLWAESYSGGRTPEAIAAAGYDAVVITGACADWSWLEITEDGATFHDAAQLRGRDCLETEDLVREALRDRGARDPGVLTIGPAGEHLVRFAIVANDYWRCAGRGGLGALLGSKKVKALGFHGSARAETGNEDLMKAHQRELAGLSRTHKGVQAFKSFGTPMMVDVMNEIGSFPTRYWQSGCSPHRDAINSVALRERCQVEAHACAKCFVACGRMTTITDGPHAGTRIEGPEYETIYSFGGLCDISAIEDIVYLNALCDRLGVDTISAGNLVALAIEAGAQNRIRPMASYGDTAGVARLIEDMALLRTEEGRIMAQGIRHAAAVWGLEDLAVHVKGMEPPGYDPRVLKGMGLSYAISDRGACHLRTTFYKAELDHQSPPDKLEGKAACLVEWEDRMTLFDMTIVCRFYRDLYTWEELERILEALTGLHRERDELQRLAAGVKNAVRRFNLREGWQPEDDALPPRLLDNPLKDSGKRLTRDDMARLLRDYYAARGWNEQGEPQE